MIRQWFAAITLASCSAAAFAQLNLPTRNIGASTIITGLCKRKRLFTA